MRWRAALFIPLSLASLAGCPAKKGEPCQTASDCEAPLACFEQKCTSTEQVAQVQDARKQAAFCKQMCVTDGQCFPEGDHCVAKEDEDCRSTPACKKVGDCRVVAGKCAPSKNEDCQASNLCKEFGLCAVLDGHCIVTEKYCASQDLCRDLGRCGVSDGKCAATKTEQCEASRNCRARAECSARDGECVVASDADCERSTWCEHFGHCKVEAGKCVEDAARCKESRVCTLYGRCDQGDGDLCRATRDADCEASRACDEDKRCRALNDVCAVDCASTPTCPKSGLCTDGPVGCRAEGQDCAKSEHCTDFARCTAEAGKCVATATDCQQHPDCAKDGRCGAQGGACTASVETCQAHANCKAKGWCGLVDGWCRAATDEHCAQSDHCKTLGTCRKTAEGFCDKGA